MAIRLVATDMDGTLLDSQKRQPADFMDWVKNHPEIKTVIASGRQYYTLVNEFIPVKDQLIYVAENGGLVFEKGKVLYSNEMKKEDIRDCLNLMEGVKGLTPILCGAESAYMKPASELVCREASIYYHHLQQTEDLYEASSQDVIVKIAVFVEEKAAEDSMKYFTEIKSHLTAVLSGDSWIDIANSTISKGIAVEVIQKKYGISKSESMAFGDYLNDADLLKSCEESYCMKNGHPDLKAIAKYIADSNDDNGVMKVLKSRINE